MTDSSSIQVTIAFTDTDRDDAEQNAQTLLAQLDDLGDVATDRVPDPNPPAGNKTAGAIIFGLLMAEVNPPNFKKLAGFLGDRLGNKPIKLKVKAPDGRELEVEASSKEELDYALQKAQEFINPSR